MCSVQVGIQVTGNKNTFSLMHQPTRGPWRESLCGSEGNDTGLQQRRVLSRSSIFLRPDTHGTKTTLNKYWCVWPHLLSFLLSFILCWPSSFSYKLILLTFSTYRWSSMTRGRVDLWTCLSRFIFSVLLPLRIATVVLTKGAGIPGDSFRTWDSWPSNRS